MATRKSPPPKRAWDHKVLLKLLGEKEGKRANYIKAGPVLILENWEKKGKKVGEANCIWSEEIIRRLKSAGLASFKPKGGGTVLTALSKIQQRFTDPPLITYKKDHEYWEIKLPHYEKMLNEYRNEYIKDYREDYDKLVLSESQTQGEPETKLRQAESEEQDEIPSILTTVEQALRDRQQAIERLTEENRKLQAELVALQATLQEGREVPHRRIVDEELRNDCAKFLENAETYIDAIRRASVVLEERLKKAVVTGSEKLQYGETLVRYALAEGTGKLVISDIPNEQKGVFELFSGAFAFVRNPPAHKKVQYTELEAWQTISLIDYLLLLLRQAKPRET
jgi:hypothetical protein